MYMYTYTCIIPRTFILLHALLHYTSHIDTPVHMYMHLIYTIGTGIMYMYMYIPTILYIYHTVDYYLLGCHVS